MRNDYFDQNCFCRICGKDFVYTAKEHQYQCEKNGKYFWRAPNYCPEHEVQFNDLNATRKHMNKSINLYFHKKKILHDTYTDVMIYFLELNHKILNRNFSQKVTDDIKIAYIKLATLYNNKEEMEIYMRNKFRDTK